MKAVFIALAVFGVIALCWHVGFLSTTVFTVAGSSVSLGLLLLVTVLVIGILKMKMK